MIGTRLSFLALFSLINSLLFANVGDGEYAVVRIPLTLLKSANAVKRMEHISFTVINKGEAILRRKFAITVLNEKGDDQAVFVAYYDKLHEIKNIEGALFDATGKELKRLKNKQIIDVTGNDDASLIDDNRRKMHGFFHKTYPYTIEYEVEEKYNGTLFFPVWVPRDEEHFSVEQSKITVKAPIDYEVRFKTFNFDGKPLEEKDNSYKSITWEMKHLPAIENEYGMPGWLELNPAVFLGPSLFEIEKYQGSMKNWNEFGKFINTLKLGRDVLPSTVKQVVHQLADPITDKREKIALLYNYLQKNTRYISIQLGIGGWQPFDANYVATKAYGDCKALTNYMYSLLKEAGINSCYTLVNAGRKARKVVPDFPAQQFNHVILCVPLDKDTVWLECTSQTLPAGYLSDFTSDRYALAIDENGGKLIRTPKYGVKENLQVRKVMATLDSEATLIVKSKASYGGLQQDQYHSLINGMSKEKVKEALHEELDFATYDIINFSYKENKSQLPFIEEELDIVVSRYATITGKRLFIMPNIMTRNYRRLPADSTRKFDLDLSFEYKDVDTVEISLPEGYAAESIPQDVTISSKFGTYSCAVKLNANKLHYYRSLEHFSGRYPAAAYPELVQFYEKIYKADRAKAVLVKSEAPKGF
jgi:Domain of Unknown Function with PDB structure (DUF3857)